MGAVDFATGSNYAWPVTMALDVCGLAFESSDVQYARINADNHTAASRCSQSKSLPGWCRTANAAGPILFSPTDGHLDWTSDGRLVMYSGGTQQWQSNSATASAQLCFQLDGNLVVYDGYDHAVWAASSSHEAATSPSDVLTFEGTNATVVNQDLESQCAAGNLPTCDASGNCTAPTGNGPSGCTSASYWTVWDSGVMAPITYLGGGGFSFVKDLHKGNSDFGAELWIVGAANNAYSLAGLENTLPSGTDARSQTLAYLPASTPPTDYMEVLGDAGISVTLFGADEIVFYAGGYGSFDPTATTPAASDLGVYGPLGAKIWDSTLSSSITPMSVSEEFFQVSTLIDVGGIPLTIAASATGEAGFNVGTSCNSSTESFGLGMTPYASLTADVSLTVGPEGVGVGIDGSLTLLQLSVPVSASASWTARSFQESMSFDVSTLSGEIDLVAEAGPLKASKTIASFNGYSTSVQLFSVNSNL